MSNNNGIRKITRPPTALQRVFEKVTLFSVFPNSSTSQRDGTTTDENNVPKLNRISSHKLYQRIGKIIKVGNRYKTMKTQLLNDLITWSGSIPNAENKLMIREFSQLLSTQNGTFSEMEEKLDKIRLSLSFVNEREKKQSELLSLKIKLDKQLKESKEKLGPRASGTILITEKLEEVECSLQVVEQQYIRAVGNDLKESVIDYVYSVSLLTRKLGDVSDDILSVLDQDNGGGEIARISPNKFSKSRRRDSKFSIDGLSLKEENQRQTYEMATPQSICADCKKVPPCSHNNNLQYEALQVPRAPAQQQPVPLGPSQTQNVPRQYLQHTHRQFLQLGPQDGIFNYGFPREPSHESNNQWK